MNKTISIIRKFAICFVLILMGIFFMGSTQQVHAATKYNELERLSTEIQEHIDYGRLPKYVENYKTYPYFHVLYQKFSHTSSSLSYLASHTEDELRSIMAMYSDDVTDWMEIIRKLDIDVTELTPNKTVGIYFDGQFLNLLWTSEYIPNELLNIYEVEYEVNGVTKKTSNKELANACSHLNGDLIFELTDNLWIINDLDVQLNMTPIMSYHSCDIGDTYYGVELHGAKDFKILGWTAEYNRYLKMDYDDPTNYYTFSCNDPVEFKLAEPINVEGKSVYQLNTHMYVNITDAIAQSIYDFNFGGYKHYVYFNTSVDLDDVYRVDVSYQLKADDEIWIKKLLSAPKDQQVTKSISKDTNKGGIFNLTTYQGLTIGNFKSNIDDSKTYKYRLMLNYDESNWELSQILPVAEADYKRIQKFFIFRINFLYKNEVYEERVEMDTIDGDTLHFYDRDLILDTTTPFYVFKETAYDVADKVEDVAGDVADTAGDIFNTITDIFTGKNETVNKALKVGLIAGGCILGIIGIGFLGKIFGFIGKLFKSDDDD